MYRATLAEEGVVDATKNGIMGITAQQQFVVALTISDMIELDLYIIAPEHLLAGTDLEVKAGSLLRYAPRF